MNKTDLIAAVAAVALAIAACQQMSGCCLFVPEGAASYHSGPAEWPTDWPGVKP